MTQESICSEVAGSACFKAEAAWLARSGWPVVSRPRLFKVLEKDLARVVFPTSASAIDEGTAVGLICLYDIPQRTTVYAHAVFAGPTSNASLRSLYNPPKQAKPQAGDEGNKAILKFVAWKQAAWGKFLLDELEFGNEQASRVWRASFWNALDRMYGGGNLLEDEEPSRIACRCDCSHAHA